MRKKNKKSIPSPYTLRVLSQYPPTTPSKEQKEQKQQNFKRGLRNNIGYSIMSKNRTMQANLQIIIGLLNKMLGSSLKMLKPFFICLTTSYKSIPLILSLMYGVLWIQEVANLWDRIQSMPRVPQLLKLANQQTTKILENAKF